MEQAEVQCKTGYDNATAQGIQYYLNGKGWIKCSQPRKGDGTKYTGREFCQYFNSVPWMVGHKIVANIGGHHTVCIKEHEGLFKVHDHWNSTEGCIGNYWIKEEL
jgi:hypothetical protein